MKERTKGFIKGGICMLLAGGIAAGVCAAGYASRDPNTGKWFRDSHLAWNKTPSDDGIVDDGNITTGATPGAGGAVVNDAISTNSVSLFSAAIPASEFEAYGISPQADTAYTLTATITPADADNKKVDYTLRWKDPDSSWASGKNVTDYGAITQTSDGSLTASYTCKQAFGEPMLIVVTARDNPQNTATCTVDYAKRATVMYSIPEQLTLDGNTSSTKTWTWAQRQSSDYASFSVVALHVRGTINDTFGVGTIENTVTSHSIEISASAALKTQLAKVFTTSAQSTAYNKTYIYGTEFSQGALFSQGCLNYLYKIQNGMFSFCSEGADIDEDNILTAQYNKLKTCLQAAATDFVITVKAEMQYGGTYSASYNVNVADSSLKTLSTGLNLDNTHIIV